MKRYYLYLILYILFAATVLLFALYKENNLVDNFVFVIGFGLMLIFGNLLKKVRK